MLLTRSTTENRADRELLHDLIAPRLAPVEDYATFFEASSWRRLPGLDAHEASGFVLDTTGRIFYYRLGWDPEAGRPALLKWEPSVESPHWRKSAEYDEARALVGLDGPKG